LDFYLQQRETSVLAHCLNSMTNLKQLALRSCLQDNLAPQLLAPTLGRLERFYLDTNVNHLEVFRHLGPHCTHLDWSAFLSPLQIDECLRINPSFFSQLIHLQLSNQPTADSLSVFSPHITSLQVLNLTGSKRVRKISTV